MAGRLIQRRGPQGLSFRSLTTASEAARFHEAGDESLKAAGAGVANAGFPGLDGARARTCSRRDLALGQPSASSKAKDQSLKVLACSAIRRYTIRHVVGRSLDSPQEARS